MSAPVFISHSSKDIKISRTICAALEHRGLHCWIAERDVDGGENYQEAIVRAIRAAKVMVLVFTTSANTSSEIKKELSLASKYGLTVVPVRTEDVIPSEAFELELATRQWIDLFAGWEDALERLANTVRRLLPQQQDAQPPPPQQPAPPASAMPPSNDFDPDRFVAPTDRLAAAAAGQATTSGHLRLHHIGAALVAVNALKLGLWILLAVLTDARVDMSPDFIFAAADLPAVLLLVAGILLRRSDRQGVRIFTGLSAAVYAFWHFRQVSYLFSCLDVDCLAYAGNGFGTVDGLAAFVLLLANIGLCGGAIVTMIMTRGTAQSPAAGRAPIMATPSHPAAAWPATSPPAYNPTPAAAVGEYHWSRWLLWAVGAVISFLVMSYVRSIF